MKKLSTLAALVFLAGCGGTGYKPDLDGKPWATVRLASVHPAASRVGVLAGECVPFVRADWEKSTRSIALLKDRSSLYQRVPANEPLTLSFHTVTTTVSGNMATDAACAVAQRFTPESGADYEAVFAGDADACRMEMRRMRPKAAAGPRSEPVPGAKELPGCP